MQQGFQKSKQASQMLQFSCPRWAQLPGIELYMDQVTGYLNEVFAPLCPPGEEKILTKAMVNNYVKQKVMAPPTKKKYGRAHVAQLLAICALNGLSGVAALVVALGVAAIFLSAAKKRLGGVTGDVYGCLIELTECAVLTVACI